MIKTNFANIRQKLNNFVIITLIAFRQDNYSDSMTRNCLETFIFKSIFSDLNKFTPFGD